MAISPALTSSLSLMRGGSLAAAVSPNGALIDRAGNYIRDRSGNYIVVPTSPRT